MPQTLFFILQVLLALTNLTMTGPQTIAVYGLIGVLIIIIIIISIILIVGLYTNDPNRGTTANMTTTEENWKTS